MSELFMKKYLEQIELAYEAEKQEDYIARRHHINIAGDIIRIAAKIETNK